MLLTLATRSLRALTNAKSASSRMSLVDIPDYAARHLKLRGINLFASELAGWPLSRLDRLRDKADKAACPCLVLVEDQPLSFAHPDATEIEKATDRVERLVVAATRLGCNSLSITCEADDNEDMFEATADEIRSLMPVIERNELNLLIAPNEGLTSSPERLTDLIKRIGGFRIGSLPSFGHAAQTGSIEQTLRKLAPYAGSIHATVMDFNKKGKHDAFDLALCVECIRAVGFVNTLAIDFHGKGDPLEAIKQARDVLQVAIDNEPAAAGKESGK
jgi:sugar phosphate isomerase/epimerase